ncbi:MAG TPA: hypothetical protein PLJ99_05175 [Kiritimatiellia bacterium]|nr:hypothetical protein [Kiritimatiellia bacterium]
MEDWNDGMAEEWVRVSTPWKIFCHVFHAMEKSFPHRGKSGFFNSPSPNPEPLNREPLNPEPCPPEP